MSVPAIIGWDQAYNRNGSGDVPRAVVNVIRTYMDNDTLAGWVKRSTLMSDTGLSERQVDRQIKANVKAGWLVITSRGHSAGKSNDYRLTYPKADTSVMGMQTDMSALTDLSTEGRQICLPNTDINVCPTSPRTSPKRSTSPVRDTDINVCLPPDPFERSGTAPTPSGGRWVLVIFPPDLLLSSIQTHMSAFQLTRMTPLPSSGSLRLSPLPRRRRCMSIRLWA